MQPFTHEDTFSCDEIGLSYKLSHKKNLAFTLESCHESTARDGWLTIFVGSNMLDIKKLPMLVIGKLKNLK